MSAPLLQFYPVESVRLAYRLRTADAPRAGKKPGLVWLGGFMSDMRSTKAQAIDDYAARSGRAFLRFDYSGHGESEGAFTDGTVSAWTAQSLALIQALTSGPQLIVGSSMGAWTALLCARALAQAGEEARIAGMVLIAPAVDFTEKLLWARLPQDVRRAIETQGQWLRPSEYSPDPYPITRSLIEDGRANCLLDGPVRSFGPVHILQGMQDTDVPWRHAMRLVEHLADDPVVVTLVKDAGHRMSGPEDIARLVAAIDALA